MEEVRRVVRAEVMLHGGQPARRFIPGGWLDPTGQTRKRLLHKHIPHVLSTAWPYAPRRWSGSWVLSPPQAQPAGKGGILGQGEVCGGHVCGGHVCGQTSAFLVAIPHER